MTTHTHGSADDAPRRRWGLGSALVFCAFLLIAAFFIFTEHRAHLFGWLPFLLLAACPLLHLFHHGGHGGAEQPPASSVRVCYTHLLAAGPWRQPGVALPAPEIVRFGSKMRPVD